MHIYIYIYIYIYNTINCFETALKNLGKWRQSDTKKENPFQTFLQISHKNFEILLLSYNVPHFVPRRLTKNFLYNKKSCKKFVPILIVCKRWRHSQKIKTDITFDLEVIFFKCHIFWRCFGWKNKITCLFCRTVPLYNKSKERERTFPKNFFIRNIF